MGRRLLYIHAPKCGGTSFGSAVRLAYFYSQATIGQLEGLIGRLSLSLQRNGRPVAKKNSAADLSETIRAKIEEYCAPDNAFYEHFQSDKAYV